MTAHADDTRPIVLLVNPSAGGGRARRERARAVAALEQIGAIDVVESRSARDETRVAREAAQANARALVVLGGDGAVSHAARGLVEAHSPVPLAILAAGTGNDFVKSLRTPSHDYTAMAALIARGRTRAIDVGSVDDIPFVNSAGFGYDVDVLERMQRAPSSLLLRGAAQYIVTALRQLFRYQGFHAELVANTSSVAMEPTPASLQWMMLVFANGQHFGGAFHIAPTAELSNGSLDCVGIRAIPPLARLSLFARALRGAHLTDPHVQHTREATFDLTFAAPPAFQADGELHRAHGPRVTIRTLPGALMVIDGS
ncbi:MAG: hypothetical protein IT353_12950 [Gemmatimonadaceae bacterium]|nr:hypothetical protein [Gemmatimonadaceae bacterium]